MRAGVALVSSSSWSSPYSDIISSASDGPSSWEERAAGWRCSGRRSCSDSRLPNHVSVADRGGYLRISPYLYTTDGDVDALLAALKAMRSHC